MLFLATSLYGDRNRHIIFLIKTIRRSQPYAFSVDGSSGELVAAGGTETETQVMVGIMVITNVMLNMTLVMVVGERRLRPM